MKKLRNLANLFRLLQRDTRGVSAIEYVVIATGMAVTVVLAWTLLGTQISSVFTNVASSISGSSTTTAVDTSDSIGSTDVASSDDDSDSDTDS